MTGVVYSQFDLNRNSFLCLSLSRIKSCFVFCTSLYIDLTRSHAKPSTALLRPASTDLRALPYHKPNSHSTSSSGPNDFLDPHCRSGGVSKLMIPRTILPTFRRVALSVTGSFSPHQNIDGIVATTHAGGSFECLKVISANLSHVASPPSSRPIPPRTLISTLSGCNATRATRCTRTGSASTAL